MRDRAAASPSIVPSPDGMPPHAAPVRRAGATRELGVAVLAAALAVGLTVLVAPLITRAIFVVSFGAVLASARWGGARAGVLTALLCVGGVAYWAIPPVGTLRPRAPTDLVAIAAFLAVAWYLAWTTDALRRARDAAAAAGDALAARNRALVAQADELSAANAQLQEVQIELEAQAEALDAERAAAEEAAARERFLAHAGELLAGSLDVAATLRQIVALAVPTLADWCALDLVRDDGRVERLAVCHPDPEKVRLAYELDARYPEPPESPHGRYHVLRTGRAEWMPDIPDALLVAACRDAEHLRIARALGLRSYIAAPLVGGDDGVRPARVLGVLSLVAAESGRRYTETDVTLAVELARRAAVALENARLVTALRESEAQLQEQAAELELQTEELEATSDALLQQSAAAEQARAAAEAARAVAEEANRAKTQFLATMSHELRTPLNAIGGYADLLALELRGPLTPTQHEDVARIKRSGQHLLALINDLLNFAKLEAGQVEFHLTAIPVATLLDDVEPLVAPQMQARGLAFEVEAPAADVCVRVDPEKARQILLNLLTNAVKFTEPGGTVRVACTTPTSAAVCLTVADTGRGIPAHQLERIFEPFVQVDRHRTHASQQGIGLGLAISRDLARGMGGDLTVASAPDAGSTFRLALPAAP